MVISLEIGPKLWKTAAKLVNQENQPTVTKFPKTGKGMFTVLGPLLLFLVHCSIRIVKNSGFCMSLYCIPVSLFLKFEATLFSALHLVLRWSLQCQILVHLSYFKYQFDKNYCKAGESRESVNIDKMSQNGRGISLLWEHCSCWLFYEF